MAPNNWINLPNAKPHPTSFNPTTTALVIIDMQRDFLEPDGFGAVLGNDVSQLTRAVEPCAAILAAAMNEGQNAVTLRDRMLELGVITRAIADHSLTFCPPLVTTEAQIDRIVDALATAASE